MQKESSRPAVEAEVIVEPRVLSDAELADVLARIPGKVRAVHKEIGKCVVGQQRTVDAVIYALLSRGHCLIEGVPGLGKTLLVRALARVLELSFNRVQFTPDLMPADITGTVIL
ncbi:MAG: AAA family ATPase, partial [Planctomycetes bacterium]|nr:AAA family ATPase [Planctomycetota bacterium]